MKNFWNLLLFKIVIALILSLYLNNYVIYILFSLFFIFTSKYKEFLIYIIVIILSLTIANINKSFINIGIVDSKENDTKCIIDNFLYKTKASVCNNVNVGDIVIIDNNSIKNTDTNDLKKQLLFTNNNKINKIYSLKIRNLINNRINSFSDETKAYIKNILLNEYNETNTLISFGFCFYYLYMFIYKKNKRLSYILLGLYLLLFGFDIKLILIYLTLISNLFNLNNINKLSLKIIIILIINKYLLLNYSILITFLISFFYLLSKNQKLYITIMQSMLFNCVNPIMSFLYKYVIIIKIISFILAIAVIIFKPFETIFVFYIKVISFLFNYLTIEIRGRLTFISILLIIIIYKLFKIKNEYIKIAIVIVLLITPINNPFAKVSFIDVGQGDSILIKDKFCKGNVLIDTGSEYNYYKLKKYLYSQGIYKIDKLIITHNDSDHNGNIENLKKDFKINEIVDSPQTICLNDNKLLNLYIGKFDNDNDNSLIYYMSFYGLNYLFTGDISKTVEKSIITNYPIKVDVLKIGHHGSKNSSSDYFIANMLPRIAIISTSGMYSHPHKEVLQILDKYNITTYITKNNGNIEFIHTSLGPIIKMSSNDFVIIKK